jgi:hypothetical protein
MGFAEVDATAIAVTIDVPRTATLMSERVISVPRIGNI